MQQLLFEIFAAIAGRYTTNKIFVQHLWHELKTRHSEPHRHYHTLTHLGQIYTALQPFWNTLENPDAVLFALFYHDSIYNPLSTTNEADSAALACRHMGELKVPEGLIQKSRYLILATQKHQITPDSDTNLFTDADLSVLGAPGKEYQQYAAAVRAEYAVYDDATYAAGRVKVLKHFLGMERIFKTSFFFESLESTTRQNMEQEILLYI